MASFIAFFGSMGGWVGVWCIGGFGVSGFSGFFGWEVVSGVVRGVGDWGLGSGVSSWVWLVVVCDGISVGLNCWILN